MKSPDAGEVSDLGAAGCPRCRNIDIGIGIVRLFQRRHQGCIRYTHGVLVMLLLIAERTRHSAAAGRNDMHLQTLDQPQQRSCFLYAHQSFLVAMPVQPQFALEFAKRFWGSLPASTSRIRNSS